MAAAIRLSQQHSCYLETESELSCGSPDFDLITEVSDAVCEPGCGFGRVATGEGFGAEVLVVSAVAQHVVDRGQDRRGHRDGRLLGTAACFEAQELSLQIAILLARCAPGGLQQYRLEPWRALFDPRRAARRLPALSSRRGTNPAHETRWPALGNWLMSIPISAITVSTAIAPSPGTSFSRSTTS